MQRVRRAIVLGIATAGSIACADSALSDQQDRHVFIREVTDTPIVTEDQTVLHTSARDSARDEWLKSAFLPSNSTLDMVFTEFGASDSWITDTYPNIHNPAAIDTVHTLVYTRGLKVLVFQGNGGRQFLISAVISGEGVVRNSAVEIATPWQRVLDLFGPPTGYGLGMPYYDSPATGDADEPVFFEVEDGAVKRIRFQFYTG